MLFLFKLSFFSSLSKEGSLCWGGQDSWLTLVIRMLSLFPLSLLQTCGSSLSHRSERSCFVLFWPFDHSSLKIHCYASLKKCIFLFNLVSALYKSNTQFKALLPFQKSITKLCFCSTSYLRMTGWQNTGINIWGKRKYHAQKVDNCRISHSSTMMV